MADIIIDADLDSASGAGTLGDPYGDLQHAIDTAGTVGHKFYIKGTDTITSTILSASGMELEGFTTVPGDGTIGCATLETLLTTLWHGFTTDVTLRYLQINSAATTNVFPNSRRNGWNLYSCVYDGGKLAAVGGSPAMGNVFDCQFLNMGQLVFAEGLVFNCIFDPSPSSLSISDEASYCLFVGGSRVTGSHQTVIADSNPYGIDWYYTSGEGLRYSLIVGGTTAGLRANQGSRAHLDVVGNVFAGTPNAFLISGDTFTLRQDNILVVENDLLTGNASQPDELTAWAIANLPRLDDGLLPGRYQSGSGGGSTVIVIED